MSTNEAIKLMQNADLTEKSYKTYYKIYYWV